MAMAEATARAAVPAQTAFLEQPARHVPMTKSGHTIVNCMKTPRYQKWVSGEGSPEAAK